MDFKSLRSDKLKLTQEEFANLYGISIQEVQELDKTGKPDMDLIVKIATKSGLDFNTILSYEKPRVKPISAKDTWEKTNFTKKSLSGYLNSALEQMDIPDDMQKNYIDDLEIGIMSKFVKPTVAIVGRSDTGKSTLINSLIGAEKMPAKWTPTTSTAVYVKHIKDRPAFIHADLTDDIINDIHVYHNRLGAVVTDIAQLEQEEYEKQKRAIEATNTTQIKKLYTIKQKLENAKTHAEFDKLLQEISAVDAEIDHDNLTSEQKTHYDQLNKSCTDTISAKMRQLEYKDNIDYNKKAVNAYNSAFTSFKNNESRYKDKSQLFGLVSTTLFAYDAGRLFNETLIFYNHVYSYIFSKLDDNGKLELTRYSIECERKLR